MNNTLRHWKEAATLILAAGSQHGNIVPKIQSQMARRDNQKQNTSDYEVLLLKRSQKSGFMPNAFVFPGGLVEPSDFSNDWMKLFERHMHKPNFGLGVVKQPAHARSPMFLTDRTQFGSLIPGEVAFRICAIRETFEESGILLVVPENSDFEDNQDLMPAYEQNLDVVTRWRQEVQNNPLQFIEMCKELRCVPNIWALHEWGNWLTPVISMTPKARRYDTAFYICCLPWKPATADDQKEVTSFRWWTPEEATDECKVQRTWIPPPQYYYLSRMCNFTTLRELHRFSQQRALEGCERWMPVMVQAVDGVVHALPGDDLYPDDVDITGERTSVCSTDRTLAELAREEGKSLHRLLLVDGVLSIFINLKPKYKHVSPLLTDISYGAEPKSKM